jgi:hypothetical protein
MCDPSAIFSKTMSGRYRTFFRTSAICMFLAGAMPVDIAAAAKPAETEELRQAVEDLREQVQILRDEVRKLSAARSQEEAGVDGADPAAGSGGGDGGSGPPSKAHSAQTPSANSGSRPPTARYRRRYAEGRPYYAYPPVWYGRPNYNSPAYAYPYGYHLYYYGVPFYPNDVIVNPYKGLWFNP